MTAPDAPTAIDADVRAADDGRAALRAITATPDVAWARAESDAASTVTPTTLEVSATVDPHDAHDSATSVHHDDHDHGCTGDHHAAAESHDADADASTEGSADAPTDVPVDGRTAAHDDTPAAHDE